jgi:trigger factor
LVIFAALLFFVAGCGSKSGETADGASFHNSEGIDENGFWKGVRALDYVEMFDYHAIPVPADAFEVSENEVRSRIENSLYSPDNSYGEVAGRAVIDGDAVNIDYVGSVDGVEFDNGSTEGGGVFVIVGYTSYVDGFLEQLIGHTPGETFDVKVTFPEDYHTEGLRGKDAVFVTTVNYIADVGDMDAMKENTRAEIRKSAVTWYVRQYLADETVIRSVPDLITEYQKREMINWYRERADESNMELEEFLSAQAGYSGVDELLEDNKESIEESARYYLVVQAIAEDAGFSVSDEDLADYFSEYYGSSDYSYYEELFGVPFLKQYVLVKKVLDYAVENAVPA